MTHIYRESKATNPSSTSKQRTPFHERTNPRFTDVGPGRGVRYYGSSTDPEETATYDVISATVCSTGTAIIEHMSRFAYVVRELPHEYLYFC